MKAVRKKFEAWIQIVRTVIDLRYDEANNTYVNIDTEWLWTAYRAGYNERKALR